MRSGAEIPFPVAENPRFSCCHWMSVLLPAHERSADCLADHCSKVERRGAVEWSTRSLWANKISGADAGAGRLPIREPMATLPLVSPSRMQ